MKIFLIIFIILGSLTGAISALVWLGLYNVAATVPHRRIAHLFLEEVRDRSISAHSKGITVPSLKNPRLFDIGFKHYHEMCRVCHGALGGSRTEIAQGLNPGPPDFSSKDTKMRNEAELYWVINNGIKMTGMPAFGPTHSEDELWGIVVFVKRLPKLKPEEYAAMIKSVGLQEERGDDHHHSHK